MKLLSAFLWKYVERVGCQSTQFILQIALARILAPSDFGIVALLSVFINFAQVFIQSGFSTALIQAKEISDDITATALYINFIIASFLYSVMFMIAPYVSAFYNMSQLTSMLRILSIVLIFGSVNAIQNAILTRTFCFKQLFLCNSISLTISALIGIYLAYSGWGAWALVYQQVSNQILICLIMLIFVRCPFLFVFRIKKVAKLFSFGWKLLISSMVNTAYREAQNLVIGRMFSSADLGFYNRGQLFPSVVVNNIDGSIQSVMLPALSQYQDNIQYIKTLMRKSTSMSAFLVFPSMIGMIVTADLLVSIVLTDKWLPCVPYLQVACVSYMFYPINTSNLTAINALGRSDIYLRLEIVKKIIGILILISIIIVNPTVYAIALSGAITSFCSTTINAYPSKNLIGYSYIEQIKDLMPTLAIAFLMGVGVHWFIGIIDGNIIVQLIVSVIAGIILYISLALFTRNQCLYILINMLYHKN